MSSSRLKSEIFVSALIRRCFVEGAFAAVVRRGADEAGAIFVTVERPDRSVDLYAPAPQTAFDGATSDRLFQRIIAGATAEIVNSRIAKEERFDSDLWVVAIEDRDGRSFLDLAPA